MGLTYDGITYRSLEEQVRYDAEQIQLLKQADVTINENLQTINTDLNGKLNKPTNPSAESAVTMLADGTVGTKSLSEIGKLYIHSLIFIINGYLTKGDIYSSRETSFTFDEIKSNAPEYIFVHFEGGGQYIGVLHLTSDLTNSFLMGVEIALDYETPISEFKSVVIKNLTGMEFAADNVIQV